MTNLSPTAQAVLDAFRSSHTGQGCLVAALRAVAKHTKARVRDSAPANDWGQGWVEGVKNAACGLDLLANELERHLSHPPAP